MAQKQNIKHSSHNTNRNKKVMLVVGFIACILLAGIFLGNALKGTGNPNSHQENSGEDKTMQYTSITMEEAKNIFQENGEYVILDVRRADEFASGHIPGAINLANEDITKESVGDTLDDNQTIYVYCRSGVRSKQAAKKLIDLGYKNIVEIGGILDWDGTIEK